MDSVDRFQKWQGVKAIFTNAKGTAFTVIDKQDVEAIAANNKQNVSPIFEVPRNLAQEAIGRFHPTNQ